jgi:hypothetical protein
MSWVGTLLLSYITNLNSPHLSNLFIFSERKYICPLIKETARDKPRGWIHPLPQWGISINWCFKFSFFFCYCYCCAFILFSDCFVFLFTCFSVLSLSFLYCLFSFLSPFPHFYNLISNTYTFTFLNP